MVKDNRLSVLGTPVFVENLNVVLGCDKAHGVFSFLSVAGDGSRSMRSTHGNANFAVSTEPGSRVIAHMIGVVSLDSSQ
ncbi:hypothetical protein D3C80_1700390 [compost metagenome]